MTEIKLPDYLFVYGILNDGRHSAATLGNAVKVRKAYGNMHVCLESYEHGEVDGSLLPVQSAAHLEELDYIEGDGYRRITIECDLGVVQTYWYKDMPLNVDTSTGKNNLVLLNSCLGKHLALINLHKGVFRNV